MSAQNLRQRLLAASTIKQTAVLSESDIFQNRDNIPTAIPLLNTALSGHHDKGLTSGVTVIAGPSKHFKTKYLLLMAKAYLEKYPEAIFVLLVNEFGSPLDYFAAEGIDPERVVVIPITTIEEAKAELANQIIGDGKSNLGLQKGDKVFFGIDSVGNLASRKEVEDAIDEKSVADMTRAKAMKSLFRIVTPHLSLKDVPLVVVNHTYKEMSLFPKDIVSGGTGAYYSADTIWIVSRSQEKEDKEIVGYHFTIKIEKSRFVKEGSKFPIYVAFDGGIDKYSGLLDLALEGGFLTKQGHSFLPMHGPYQDGTKLKKTDLTADFWEPMLAGEFGRWLHEKFALVQEVSSEE